MLYSTTEVAKQFGCTAISLRQAIRRTGIVVAVGAGGAYRLSETDIEELRPIMAKHKKRPTVAYAIAANQDIYPALPVEPVKCTDRRQIRHREAYYETRRQRLLWQMEQAGIK